MGGYEANYVVLTTSSCSNADNAAHGSHGGCDPIQALIGGIHMHESLHWSQCVRMLTRHGAKRSASQGHIFTVAFIAAMLYPAYTLALFRFYRLIEVDGGHVAVHIPTKSYSLSRDEVTVGVEQAGITAPPLLGPLRRVTITGREAVVEAVLHARDADRLLEAFAPNDRYEGAPMD